MKIATICYLPPGADSRLFAEYVCNFHPPILKSSDQSSDVEVVHYFMSSTPGSFAGLSGVNVHLVPDPIIVKGPIGKQRPTDLIATQVFLQAINLATETGADYFFYYEADCRFRQPGWFSPILKEFMWWKEHHTNVLLAGTPVSWHPWCIGQRHSRLMQEYAYRVISITDVPMAFEGDYSGNARHALYPNGALAFYHTAFAGTVFGQSLAVLRSTSYAGEEATKEELMRVRAFDLFLGNRLFELHGSGMFELLKPLSTVYSGCGDHHITLAERLEMLRTPVHPKYAVHHIKPSEISMKAFTSLFTPKPSNENCYTVSELTKRVGLPQPDDGPQG